MIVKKIHEVCNIQCERLHTICCYSNKASCYDMPCPFCTKSCELNYNYSKCSKLCYESCKSCAEDYSWSCSHCKSYLLSCAVFCDLLPCSKRCAKMLTCEHWCLSICEEVCSDIAYCQICTNSKFKKMIVNFNLSFTFEKVNFDKNLCIVSLYRYILTLKSMNRHMSILDFYIINDKESMTNLKNNAKLFSTSKRKSCSICRDLLQNLNCYNRIVCRALIDEAPKKFIVWANTKFISLISRIQAIETEFRETIKNSQTISHKILPKTCLLEFFQLKKTRDYQIC